jgi:hypothetical protein
MKFGMVVSCTHLNCLHAWSCTFNVCTNLWQRRQTSVPVRWWSNESAYIINIMSLNKTVLLQNLNCMIHIVNMQPELELYCYFEFSCMFWQLSKTLLLRNLLQFAQHVARWFTPWSTIIGTDLQPLFHIWPNFKI